MVEHEEDRARTVFRPGEQGQVIGTEIENQGEKVKVKRGSARKRSPTHRQRRCSYPGTLGGTRGRFESCGGDKHGDAVADNRNDCKRDGEARRGKVRTVAGSSGRGGRSSEAPDQDSSRSLLADRQPDPNRTHKRKSSVSSSPFRNWNRRCGR